jgi:hypothetical protein
MRDNPGPRAVLNALERLADGYETDIRGYEAEIALKEGQLRDYESRIGKPFVHEEYASQLADLRDKLKLGLSERAPEGGTPTAELAEQIKALRASVTVEAAPERVTRKAARAERPVTARIRERRGEKPEVVEAEAVEVKPEPPAVVIPLPEPVKAAVDYRQAVTGRRQGDGRQMSLF